MRFRQSVLIASLLVATGLGGILVTDMVSQTRLRSKLQTAVNDAALTGVVSLASNTEAEPAVAQQEASAAAINEFERRFPGAKVIVTPNSANLSVHIIARAHPNLLGMQSRTTVKGESTASYLPPSEPRQLLANRLHWRQYAETNQ